MRILLLTLVVPNPPDSGPKIKTHYLLRYLAQRHEVTLVSFVRDAAEQRAARELEGLCAAVHTVPMRRARWRDAGYLLASLASARPFLMLRDESRAMRRLAANLVARERFDLAQADQLNMVQFGLASGLPLVFDAHNAVWTIFQRLARQERGPKRLLLELEWRKLKRYEGRVCRASAAVMAVSAEDRVALRAAGARDPISVIPIAVDIAGVEPARRKPDAQGILSMATMYWPPNIDGVLWFAREVLPLIRRAAPDAPFFVVGARPPAEVQALGDDPTIAVTGYVDDPAPYLESSALMVVPLRAGGGMRVKILEALARGIPIVSTTIGAEGIDVTP
ncbi:MAG TPA: glycosyltransferase, partial [Roseiflexaceae bacterium]